METFQAMNESQVKHCIRCGTALVEKIYHDNHMHKVCPACDWAFFPDPKVAAAVLVFIDKKVLLVKRLFDPMQGFWTLPAGFVNANEDPARAAERECKEETGLEVKTGEVAHIITGRDHPRGADIVLVYKAEWISGEVQAQDDAQDAGFFGMDELPPLAFSATRVALGLPD
jgi:8-oxo-dGTP diphosphatase